MIGKPKYKLGQKVRFKLDGQELVGVVFIVDKFGTFCDKSDVFYDILCKKPKECLYKHITEKLITPYKSCKS